MGKVVFCIELQELRSVHLRVSSHYDCAVHFFYGDLLLRHTHTSHHMLGSQHVTLRRNNHTRTKASPITKCVGSCRIIIEPFVRYICIDKDRRRTQLAQTFSTLFIELCEKWCWQHVCRHWFLLHDIGESSDKQCGYANTVHSWPYPFFERAHGKPLLMNNVIDNTTTSALIVNMKIR